MSDEIVLAKMAASMGISVTALRMRLAVTDTNGRDVMQDIVADSRGRSIHDPAGPEQRARRGAPIEEVPLVEGSGWSATYARRRWEGYLK